ncbi:hypothetical protein [Bradyrhizobium sp. SEMIA]|uniref:hypothetical protein n=1 Tax=Bradyrhizobium sp. SEMIA TaxID=2597515 RepID=UPI0018A63990|nr:hypothetical protein [Bradyrhizobium sp. SEMIA]QOG20412.1 hypothetical protein FOM02_26745 [Bradyrhizobium sp. SEMIA]
MTEPPPLPSLAAARKQPSPILRAISIGLFCFFVILICYSLQEIQSQRAAAAADARLRDAAAVAAGFADDADLRKAKSQNITDPAAWRTKVAGDKARAEKRAAELKAELAELQRPVTDRMDITDQSWEKGGFNSVGIMNFTIKNGNAYAVKDVTVSCRFFGKSGTLLNDNSQTVYDIVPANATKRFTKVNVGFINSQAQRGGCDLKNARRL